MRTPGIYSDIKVATQRNQLPNQAHKIIFINTDVPKEIPPTDIFDTAEADAKAKPQSNAGRMMAAALMVSQGVDVEMATWTRRREDIKCDYKETFSMPFNADGTATANIYYNHKSYLQTASMTIRQDSVATSYEFLGGATPADAEDIVGCSLLAGGVVDGVAEFTIYGFSKDARFDDGKFDAVDVLLELQPLLTREQVRIDEKFEFVDVIPAASAGMASSEGDVYPHLIEPLVNSCCELVIIDGTGGGGGGSGTGDGDGTGGDDPYPRVPPMPTGAKHNNGWYLYGCKVVTDGVILEFLQPSPYKELSDFGSVVLWKIQNQTALLEYMLKYGDGGAINEVLRHEAERFSDAKATSITWEWIEMEANPPTDHLVPGITYSYSLDDGTEYTGGRRSGIDLASRLDGAIFSDSQGVNKLADECADLIAKTAMWDFDIQDPKDYGTVLYWGKSFNGFPLWYASHISFYRDAPYHTIK